MKREILVKFIIDWEDYDDVCDELILEDLELNMKVGASYEIIKGGSDGKD